MRWLSAAIIVAVPVIVIGAIGGRYAHRRKMRKLVAAFLEAIRSGNISVEDPESSIGSGERSRMFRGQAGLSNFLFMMKTDVNGTIRSYSLIWHDIGVAVGAWNPLKADASHGLHDAYGELLKLAERRPKIFH